MDDQGTNQEGGSRLGPRLRLFAIAVFLGAVEFVGPRIPQRFFSWFVILVLSLATLSLYYGKKHSPSETDED